jgi:p-aminobenzoyl-glutamate transporter AbgT
LWKTWLPILPDSFLLVRFWWPSWCRGGRGFRPYQRGHQGPGAQGRFIPAVCSGQKHGSFFARAYRQLLKVINFLLTPKILVTITIVFAGVVSNTASEMGYVVLVPLAAVVFLALGRHPLAGLAAAFAGVSGGYSANLLIGTVDPLLAGITEEAAQLIDPGYLVHPAVNWYFMIVSTFLITIVGSWVTLKIVEPKLGKYDPSIASEDLERRPEHGTAHQPKK